MRLKNRVVATVPVTEDAREAALAALERDRADAVQVRRTYSLGKQYDEKNMTAAKAAGCSVGDLPEHEKLLAYSTQIGDCLDFLSDRLGEGFKIEADDVKVQEVIDSVVAATESIAAENEDGDVEIVTDDLLRDALTASDVAAYVGFDPIEQRPYLEFWESEHVEFRMATATRVQSVIRTEVVWRESTEAFGDWREVTERLTYEMVPNEAGVLECRVETTWDGETDPIDTVWLGIGRLPWALLRADKRALREFRGESLVTDQVMMQADRYNAVEQVSYLIARYNSHGNLVVVGDGAQLKASTDERVHKDVADVLTFPGGTNAFALTLPTDPKMIEHQRQVLGNAIYSAFGLVRVEPDTLQGLGGVTGYALEILNQKSETTFKRVARRWRKDFTTLFGLCLDVHAWKTGGAVGLLDLETGLFTEWEEADLMTAEIPLGQVPMQQWWSVEPDEEFPNRKIKIAMGSGYIVDDVMIRDDFVAGLISREEGLRLRGYEPNDIDDIVGEVEAAEEKTAAAGQTPGESSPGSSTQSGSTVGGTTSRGSTT